MRQKHEFDTIAGLEDAANQMARASRHPLYADLGEQYDELRQPDGITNAQYQDGLHCVWNNRDDKRAYVGSKRYNLIQHREVVDAIRSAVGNTTGSIEKGVVRDYGAHVNGTLVFGDQDQAIINVHDLVGDGYIPPEGSEWTRDRLGLGMRFHNSFDGRSGFGGSTMAYRFICQNWMVWGEETISERRDYHIKSKDDEPGIDPEYFEDVIKAVFERREAVEGTVKDAIEEGEMPIEWTPGMLREAGFGANYSKRITGRLLDMDEPNEGETTTWHLYNAATSHLDNDREASLGPEPYDRHQETAWSILEDEPEAPEEQMEDREELEEYAIRVEA